MPIAPTKSHPRPTNGKAHQEPHVQVVRVPLSRIIPHPQNARRGNVDQIRLSLSEFGQFKPLVVQRSTKRILCGNHTYLAAQALEWTHIDVHYQDIDDEKALRLALADNGTGDLATWDDQVLLEQLRSAGKDVPGFDEKFVRDLEKQMRALGQGDDPGPQTGRADELAQEWGTAEGQAWTIPSLTRPGESHRLVCGDSTDGKVVERALAGARPRLMVTDPPYGVANDDRADWTRAWAHFPGDVAYVWHGGLKAGLVQRNLESCGLELRAQIVWMKPGFMISRGHYSWQHEPCLYAVRQGADSAWRNLGDPDPEIAEAPPPPPEYWFDHCLCSYGIREGSTAEWIGDRNQSTVWKIAHDKTADGGHATQKPLECMERPIRNHEGDVYEPFCGSGTTLIAAERQGRICHAIELLPACLAIILQRCKDFGMEPALEQS